MLFMASLPHFPLGQARLPLLPFLIFGFTGIETTQDTATNWTGGAWLAANDCPTAHARVRLGAQLAGTVDGSAGRAAIPGIPFFGMGRHFPPIGAVKH